MKAVWVIEPGGRSDRTTPAILRGLVEHCPGDLQPGPFVQSAEDLLATPDNRFRELHARLWPVLDWLLR